ncbi:CGNR zinc finger domain-containing protein [Streptomyces sp. NPDC059568]|uniref:CGNR zinc finger domain-containing protein n=1 Tax=Streptomyces sp. NPDC059568 TaxID=3346868 RepID=UPI0036747F16
MPEERGATPVAAIPLPGVQLVLEFVNTRSIVGSPEHLQNAASMRDWLRSHCLIRQDDPVTAADVAYAGEIRAALVTLLLDHVDHEGEGVEEAEQRLARAADLHPVAPRIGVDSGQWMPLQSGVAGFFGAVLAAAAQVGSSGSWKRLKACKNHACYLGFLDRTKNSSAMYCSSKCSSQMASRAYRTRQAEARAAGEEAVAH